MVVEEVAEVFTVVEDMEVIAQLYATDALDLELLILREEVEAKTSSFATTKIMVDTSFEKAEEEADDGLIPWNVVIEEIVEVKQLLHVSNIRLNQFDWRVSWANW